MQISPEEKEQKKKDLKRSDGATLEDIGIYFELENGSVELVAGGHDIALTNENVEEFVELV